MFEIYISKEINQFDLKQLYSSSRDARTAIKRSWIELKTKFKSTALTSMSQSEVVLTGAIRILFPNFISTRRKEEE